ncbi:DUF4350 domain-containing protein [Piscinibacter terrae]|uniref:DUF4350 domain-containing protein n=1 Tax=Piscinibacter terrae TaxID=2496871 RepID=A0A3N7HWB1_9BURK|nr:DUF4350 domain-containing protein [Albitalea terrae]RQP26143.1 DUF4350 domain-containing protein [Albitalea terrae]
MTLHRDLVWNIAFVVALALGGLWFVNNTYWADERVPDPAKGEAAKDMHYAAKKLVRELGGKVVSPDNLDRLPPTSATLVLNSWDYDFFPERDKRLQAWVQAGGHLVSEQWKRPKWIGIDNDEADKRTARRGGAASAPPPPPPPRRPRRLLPDPTPTPCFGGNESTARPGAYDEPRSYKMCTGMERVFLVSKSPLLWSVDSSFGPAIARVAVGQGQATVILGSMSFNHELFAGDHALAYVAALNLKERPEVWFVDSETREPLLKLIWHKAAPVVLIAAGLIVLALWRAILRFGPRAPVPPLSRRSVAEQVRGTSSFIFKGDSQALHRAQLRSLEQAARRSIRDHDKLDRRSRAEAIARATAVDADSLARAMDTTLNRPRRDLVTALALLETATRRLTLNR